MHLYRHIFMLPFSCTIISNNYRWHACQYDYIWFIYLGDWKNKYPKSWKVVFYQLPKTASFSIWPPWVQRQLHGVGSSGIPTGQAAGQAAWMGSTEVMWGRIKVHRMMGCSVVERFSLFCELFCFGHVLGSWFLVVVGCWLLVVGCWLVAVGCWFVVGGCRRLIVDCWLLGWLLVVVHIPVPWSQTLPAKTQHVALFNTHWFSPTSMTLSGYCSALGWWRLITVHTRFPNKLEAYDGYVCVYIYACTKSIIPCHIYIDSAV